MDFEQFSKDEIHPLKTSELDKVFEEIIEGTPISDTADTPITPTTSENILEEILRVDILFKIIDFGLSKVSTSFIHVNKHLWLLF